MSGTQPSLSAAQLAILFTQLRQFESAGLPAFQVFAVLAQTDQKLKIPLALMQRQLKSGQPISEAGFRAGIFNATQKSLIQAAESSGRLTEFYGQLADYYTGLSVRINKIKSRLYFPALVLVIALFVQPLPALVSSQIGLGGYLQLSLGRLLVIFTGVFLLVRLPGILRGLGVETAWHRLQMGVPVVAGLIVRRQLNEFFFILAMLLDSGLAFAEALPKAVAAIKNKSLREQFTPALSMLGSGASVADTLAEVTIINATLQHIVNSSEQSGKLASGILQFTQREAEAISLQDNALAAWLPRVIYSLVAIWMAYSILGSQFGTNATLIP